MRQMAVLLFDITLWLLGRMAHIIFRFLGWRFVSRIGKFRGDINYYLNRGRHRITKEELTLLFGNRLDTVKIMDITKRSFENYYMRQLETFFFGSLDMHTLNKMIHAEGIKNLDNALLKGRGVILLLSHFGSFLLPLPFLGYMGYKVNQVTGIQKHASLPAKRIWAWRKREAERLPVKFIQVDRFLRPVYKALKNNEIVAIAFDGRDSSKWVVADFLERKALFSSGPFELAIKTGAAIVPTFIVRQRDSTHKLIFESPFELTKDGDAEKALSINTKRYTKIFSDYVAKYPCHFGMILYRFKEAQKLGIAKPFFAEN